MPDRQYIYFAVRTRDEQRAHPRYPRVPLDRRPREVWLMLAGHRDPDYQHDPTLPLVHRETAAWEDIGHDWSYRDGHLQYSPGGERDGGVWIVAVF